MTAPGITSSVRLPEPIMERLLSKREAAKMLGVSERTIDNYRAAGRLRDVRLSEGVLRFDPRDLRAFVDAAKSEGAR